MIGQVLTSLGYFLIAVALAALLPVALILTREELRKVRFRLVEELVETVFIQHRELPQLKLVSARYAATGDSRQGGRRLPGTPSQALVRIWAGGFVFFLVSLLGFSLLTMPRTWLVSEVPSFPMVTYALLWTSEASGNLQEVARPLTIVGIAFLGGYVYQLRYLVRATLNQELGALAFVRATLQIVQGMIVSLVAYRFMGEAMGGDNLARGFAGAVGVAFLFGMFPNLGLVKIAKYARVRSKTVDEDALAVSRVIPLEIIDGIDAETAFRLEESNLYDVQNLASINPIELYAESPYTLLEIFDWVLQAQLCANVGPQCFATLKNHKIRTIFDLERAVLAGGAPEAYIRAIGAVLFLDASSEFRRRVGLNPPEAPVEGVEIDPRVVRHAVAIMADDLHVHRLRALWRIMIQTTTGLPSQQSPWLYHAAPLPGDAGYDCLPLGPAAEAFLRLALHLGGTYREQKAASAEQSVLDATRAECLAAVRKALALDPESRERLRQAWNPDYLGKRPDEDALEIFFTDPEFVQTLDPPPEPVAPPKEPA